jgi:hypothetical protein
MKKSNRLLLSALIFAVLFILGAGIFYPKFAPKEVEGYQEAYGEVKKMILQEIGKEESMD